MDADVVAPRLVNPDGSLQTSKVPFPSFLNESLRLFHLKRWLGKAPQNHSVGGPQPSEDLKAANLLIRRELLDQIGHLDEGRFMYIEEIDLGYLADKRGWKRYRLPEAVVMHHGGHWLRIMVD